MLNGHGSLPTFCKTDDSQLRPLRLRATTNTKNQPGAITVHPFLRIPQNSSERRGCSAAVKLLANLAKYVAYFCTKLEMKSVKTTHSVAAFERQPLLCSTTVSPRLDCRDQPCPLFTAGSELISLYQPFTQWRQSRNTDKGGQIARRWRQRNWPQRSGFEFLAHSSNFNPRVRDVVL